MRKPRQKAKDSDPREWRQSLLWLSVSFLFKQSGASVPISSSVWRHIIVTTGISNCHFVSVLFTPRFLRAPKDIHQSHFLYPLWNHWTFPQTGYSLFPILNFNPGTFSNKNSNEESQLQTNMLQTYKTDIYAHMVSDAHACVCMRVLLYNALSSSKWLVFAFDKWVHISCLRL